MPYDFYFGRSGRGNKSHVGLKREEEKMSRCSATKNLEVHHKNRGDGNNLENAQVLCQHCHENTPSYGTQGKSPPEFSSETKKAALERAGNQCECEKNGCHGNNESLKNIKEALTKFKYCPNV